MTTKNEIQKTRSLLQKLPAAVRLAREKRKFTQTEFAKLFGIDQSAVSRIENGNQEVPLDMALWLVEVGGV